MREHLRAVRYTGELTLGEFRCGAWLEDGEPFPEWVGRRFDIPFDEERTGQAILSLTWSFDPPVDQERVEDFRGWEGSD